LGNYQVKFSRTAVKKYLKLPLHYKEIVDINLLKFQQNIPTDIKAIQGEENCYRMRIGRYRILLTISDDQIIVSDIGTRGGIYK
jgi:mRNA interferase RelE/StbE